MQARGGGGPAKLGHLGQQRQGRRGDKRYQKNSRRSHRGVVHGRHVFFCKAMIFVFVTICHAFQSILFPTFCPTLPCPMTPPPHCLAYLPPATPNQMRGDNEGLRDTRGKIQAWPKSVCRPGPRHNKPPIYKPRHHISVSIICSNLQWKQCFSLPPSIACGIMKFFAMWKAHFLMKFFYSFDCDVRWAS